MKKKLRCLISFTLITALLFSFVNANAEVENTNPQSGAYDFLKTINVLDEGIIPKDLSHEVSRGEFSLILSNALGYKDVETPLESNFADVSADSEYHNAISILKSMGIINGANDGLFRPDEKILYPQGIKMAVAALGYDVAAADKGGYPVGYMSVAGSIGILNNLSSNLSESMTLGECSLFIKKVLETEVLKIDSVGNGVNQTYHVDEGDTLMKVKLGIINGRGRVTANDITGLVNPSEGLKGYIRIDGVQYKASESAYKLLGYSVNFYYKEAKNSDDNEIVYIEARSSNDVINISANDVEGFDNMTYSVLPEDKDKAIEYELSRNIDVIINGVSYPDYSLSDLTPVSGSITLIDSDGNNEYETIIINSVQSYVVNNITNEGTVYDVLGKDPLELNGSNNVVLNMIKQGEKATTKDIGQYSVLSVSKSLNTSGKLNINIKIIDKTVSGNITEIIKENEAIKKIKIGDTLYNFSKELNYAMDNPSMNISQIENGLNVIAYLNEFDEVIYYKADNFETDRYGYVIKGYKDKGLKDNVSLRLINDEGTWCTLDVEDKIKLNGKSATNSTDVWAELYNNSFIRQLIRYRLNKEGNVNMIDTQKTTAFESRQDSLTFDNINPNNAIWKYKRGSRTFEGFFSLSNKSIVFSVPGEGLEDDESQYAVGNAGYFTEGVDYRVHPYNLNDTLISNVIVEKSSGVGGELAGDITLALIDKVAKVSVNDEDTYKITGLKDNKPFSVYMRDNSTLFIDRTDKNIQKDCGLLNSGDVIRYQLDMQKKVSNIERVVDSSTGAVYQKGGGYRDGYNLRGGWVYGMQEDIIALTTTATANLADINETNVATYCLTYSMQPPQIMLYDTRFKKVSMATINDLVPYTLVKNQDDASFVYLHTVNGDPKSAVIFKR